MLGVPDSMLLVDNALPRFFLAAWILANHKKKNKLATALRKYLMQEVTPQMSRKFNCSPIIKFNPLVALLTECPLLKSDFMVFREDWSRGDLDAAFEYAIVKANPVLLTHHEPFTRVTCDFLEEIAWVPGKELGGWHFQRLSQFRYIQYARIDCPLDLISWASMHACLPEPRYSYVAKRLVMSPPMPKTPPTLDTKLELMLRLENINESKQMAAILSEAQREDEALSYDGILATFAINVDQEKFLSEAEEYSKSHSKSPRRDLYLCACTAKGMPGKAELEQVIEKSTDHFRIGSANDPTTAAAAALLVNFFTFTVVEEIRLLDIDSFPGFACSPVKIQTSTLVESTLHHAAISVFPRPLPGIILDAIAFLKRFDPVTDSDVNVFLRSISPRITLSKLQKALCWQCPVWYEFPDALVQTGLFPQPKTVDSSRSYISIGRDHWVQCIAWLRMVAPDYELPPEESWPGRVGSRFTPKTEVLKIMILVLKNMLAEKDQDLDSEIRTHNASASILLLAWRLLCGARHYPINFPDWWPSNGGAIPGFQKVPSLYTWPHELDPLCRDLLRLRKRIIQRRRYTAAADDSGVWLAHPFKFLVSDSGELLPLDLNCYWLHFSLLACKETKEFARLHISAMRHFSMTLLYSVPGLACHDIEAFHHRHTYAFSPINKYSFEDPRLPTATRRIRGLLSTAIGL